MVSLITVTQYNRIETIELLADHINNQTYKNIIEWVIVEGSKTPEDAFKNKEHIEILRTLTTVPIVYIEFTGKPLGYLRNLGNRACTGDITVCMDDDDYYPPCRVDHVVKKLGASECLIAGCSEKYLYDYDLKIFYSFKALFGLNHSTNDCMAWKKEYLLHNSHDETVHSGEEKSFTKSFSEPMVQLDPIKCIISSSHRNNTYNKKEICVFTSIGIYPKASHVETPITTYIPEIVFEKYKNIFCKCSETPFDIVYFTGGTSIIWDPSDKKLGGSEQAVVHLTKEWAISGKNVAVYGNFKFDEFVTPDGVKYYNWKLFDYGAKYKTIIMWRMAGSNCLLPFDVKCEKLIMDFHDNTFQFRFDYKKHQHKITTFLFKSKFHLDTYQGVHGVLGTDRYKIIPNGLRVDEFKNPGVERNPYRFCYCSCYTRGLYELLKYTWPIIYHNEPRAELHVYYGMVFVQDNKFKYEMTLLLAQPGVMDHGRMPVELIAREKWQSTFHLYVTDTTSEIDCISIRESLVCGCIPLISKAGVFNERDGLHFNINENKKECLNLVANQILSILPKADFLTMCRNKFSKSDTIMSWLKIKESIDIAIC